MSNLFVSKASTQLSYSGSALNLFRISEERIAIVALSTIPEASKHIQWVIEDILLQNDSPDFKKKNAETCSPTDLIVLKLHLQNEALNLQSSSRWVSTLASFWCLFTQGVGFRETGAVGTSILREKKLTFSGWISTVDSFVRNFFFVAQIRSPCPGVGSHHGVSGLPGDRTNRRWIGPPRNQETYPTTTGKPENWFTRSLVAHGSNSQTRTKIQFHWSLEKSLHLNQPKKRTLRFCYSFSILDILFQIMMSGNWIIQSSRSPVFPKMFVFFLKGIQCNSSLQWQKQRLEQNDLPVCLMYQPFPPWLRLRLHGS